MRDLAAMMTRRSLGREASTDHSHEDGERAVDAVLVTLQDPQPARHRRVPRPLTQRRQETAKHEQPFQRPDTTETTLVPLAVWQLDKATAAILPIIDCRSSTTSPGPDRRVYALSAHAQSLRAYSSASRPATRPSATAARQITETIPGGRARDPRA